MGLETTPETLLRLIRTQTERQVPTPRVLGVDDFSFCRETGVMELSSSSKIMPVAFLVADIQESSHFR